MNIIARFRPILAALCFFSVAAPAFAQGSAFTYQGKLTDGGTPATGAYDFRFILYNADAGGSQVGTTLTADDVVVTAGAFTVVLDFGPNIFDGQARWLELAVRQGASTGIYTVLSPRQPVTPAPYAIFAAKAGSVANGGITAAQLAPGAVTGAAIAGGAITADKIPDGAISTNKLSPAVLAGLGGAPSGAVLMSQDSNATNLTAAGYVRFGSEVIANQSEVILFNGDYQPLTSPPETIWTGSDLLIWGGVHNSVAYRYNLSSNRFTLISAVGVPFKRESHVKVWTGMEMIVWGGRTNNLSPPPSVNTGGRYRISNDSWTATTTTGAPSGRSAASAVWTGSEMIVWGGYSQTNNGFLDLHNTGGRYNPTSNSWTPVSTVNAPDARYDHIAVWTGTQMLVWGGSGAIGFDSATGGLYNPVTDSWVAMNTVDAPTRGDFYAKQALWTGTHLVVFDSLTKRLTRYSTVSDTWESLPPPPEDPSNGKTGVWTGSTLLFLQSAFPGGPFANLIALEWSTLTWTSRGYGKPGDFTSLSAHWIGDSVLQYSFQSASPLLRVRPQNPLYLYVKP